MKTEARLMQDCYLWLHNTYPKLHGLYFEIANNAFSVQSGIKHKAIGRIAGVADSCLLIKKTVVFFEFKTEIGRQSLAQKNWQTLIESAGYKYFIIRLLSEFKNIICQLV